MPTSLVSYTTSTAIWKTFNCTLLIVTLEHFNSTNIPYVMTLCHLVDLVPPTPSKWGTSSSLTSAKACYPVSTWLHHSHFISKAPSIKAHETRQAFTHKAVSLALLKSDSTLRRCTTSVVCMHWFVLKVTWVAQLLKLSLVLILDSLYFFLSFQIDTHTRTVQWMIEQLQSFPGLQNRQVKTSSLEMPTLWRTWLLFLKPILEAHSLSSWTGAKLESTLPSVLWGLWKWLFSTTPSVVFLMYLPPLPCHLTQWAQMVPPAASPHRRRKVYRADPKRVRQEEGDSHYLQLQSAVCKPKWRNLVVFLVYLFTYS